MSKKSQSSAKKFFRGNPTRKPRELVLMVCEGEKTEPQYFDGLRKRKRLSTADIVIYGGDDAGTHPKSVVEYAIKKKLEKAKTERYDHVWCIFDRDEHKNIEEAFNLALKNGIRIAFSNPNFELWFLLHYHDQRGALSRQEAIKKLKRYIPDYEKNASDMYEKLLDKQEIAIDRAILLRSMHLGNGDDQKENPSSAVDLLVKLLNDL
jgi:RloB-like protein